MTDPTPDYLALADRLDTAAESTYWSQSCVDPALRPLVREAAHALRIADKTIREPLNAFCRDTFRIARNGECPVHGGDACLLSPFGWKQENDRLREALRDLEHLHLCDDDTHDADCKKDHGQMLLPNPAGCRACRIFARRLLSEKGDATTPYEPCPCGDVHLPRRASTEPSPSTAGPTDATSIAEQDFTEVEALRADVATLNELKNAYKEAWERLVIAQQAADLAASKAHDAMYETPPNVKAASDAIWEVHSALRPSSNPSSEVK